MGLCCANIMRRLVGVKMSLKCKVHIKLNDVLLPQLEINFPGKKYITSKLHYCVSVEWEVTVKSQHFQRSFVMCSFGTDCRM